MTFKLGDYSWFTTTRVNGPFQGNLYLACVHAGTAGTIPLGPLQSHCRTVWPNVGPEMFFSWNYKISWFVFSVFPLHWRPTKDSHISHWTWLQLCFSMQDFRKQWTRLHLSPHLFCSVSEVRAHTQTSHSRVSEAEPFCRFVLRCRNNDAFMFTVHPQLDKNVKLMTDRLIHKSGAQTNMPACI